MKRMQWLPACGLVMLLFLISCSSHSNHGNINYTVSESGNYLSIRAKYDRQQSSAVERFMTSFFKSNNNNISFKNTAIDGDLRLDDGTTFYIKKTPGYLYIKFNKGENSTASYFEMKSLSNKLKTVITKQ